MELLVGLACVGASVALGIWLIASIVRPSGSAGPARRGRTTPSAPGYRAGTAGRRSTAASVGYTISVTVGGEDAPRQKDDARWVPDGEVVAIRGYSISGGLIYVGRHLNPVSGWRAVEPALINPRLAI